MSSENQLKEKIKELQLEIAQKNVQITQYRTELIKVNEALEKISLQMNQEVKMAETLQKVLAPVEIPNISGVSFSSKFVPGSLKGGDYFEIFEHEDKMKFGILMSSCSGYVLSAALIGVLIKFSAQIEARKGLEQEKVIKKMVSEVVPNIEGDDSASVFYAVIDRRNFEVKYSSIGNILGLLQVNAEGRLIQLEPSGEKLCRGYSMNPLGHSMNLGPRDRLILCTEGMIEAENSSHQTFGREGVQKTLLRSPKSGVHEVRNELLFQLEQFTGVSEPVRDVTVLVAEVNDRVIKLAKKS